MKKEKKNIEKTKKSFIKYFKRWGVIFLISLASILIVYEIISSIWEFENRVEKLRKYYTQNQKELIENEVNRVADLINFQTEKVNEQLRVRVKARVYEGFSIAQEIYTKFKGEKSAAEIQRLIINVLRPIKFENGDGYYFIADLNGKVKLHGGRPDFEGTDQLHSADKKSGEIVKNMIKIARNKGEGFYEYFWEKPNSGGKYFKKITFLKLFKPYNWYMGTGVYVAESDSTIRTLISKQIEKRRFGPNNTGYVFILRLFDINGGKDFAKMYINPNRPDLIGKLISDETPDAKGKLFRKEFLKGLKEKGECFVEYWYKKFNNPEPSPKVSFFKLAGNGQYIVAAGVYLDDIENEIAGIESNLRKQVILKVLISILIVIVILFVFLVLFNLLARKLKNDFRLFDVFLKNASKSNNPIDLNEIQYAEIENLALAANNMLKDKISAEQNVADERERLYVTLRSIGDGLITTDKTGKIVLINSVAEKLTGWINEDAKGKSLTEVFNIVNKDTGKPVSNPVEQVLAKGEIVGLANHTLLISKDGTEHQIADSASPIKDANNNIIGVVLVFRDVTKEYWLQRELKKNQEMNEAILKAMPDLLFVINKKNEFVSYFAPVFENLYAEPKDFINKNVREALPPNIANIIIDSSVEVFKTGEVITFEYDLDVQGESKFFEARMSLKGNEEILIIVRNITEAKKAKQELIEREEKFRKTFATSPDSITISSIETGEYVSVNKGFCDVMGFTEEEVIGIKSTDLNIWMDNADRETVITNVKAKGSIENFEAKFRAKNGDLKVGLLSARVIELKGVPHLVTIVRDITDRKEMENSLRENEEKFRKIFQTSPDAITITRAQDGRYVSVNKRFTEVAGYSEEELIGKTVVELGLWQNEKEMTKFAEATRNNGFVENFEANFWLKDGTKAIVLLSSSVLILKGVPHILVIVKDITKRKEMEEKFKEISLLKKAILESPEGIVVFALDKEYRYLDFTLSHKTAMKTIWGVDVELGKNMLDYIGNEEDRKKAKENFDRALAGEKFETFEEYGNLERLFYENRYSPVYDEDGNIMGVSIYVIDITERRKAQQRIEEMLGEMEIQSEELRKKNMELEDARKATLNLIEDLELQMEERIRVQRELRKSEARHRLISDLTSDYLFETRLNEDGSYEMVWVTGAFEQITGYTVEEYKKIGGWKATIHPDDVYLDDETFAKIAKNEKASVELRTFHKNGSITWVRSLASPIWDKKNNRLIGVIGAVKNITEDKQNQIIHEIEYNIANAAVTAKTTRDLISVVKLELSQIINTKELYIAFYNSATDMFSMYVYEDSKDEFETWQAGKSMSGYVLKAGKSLLLKKDEILKLAETGEIEIIGTLPEVWFGIPLRVGEKNIGIIVSQSYDNPKAFNKASVKALEIVANQISLFIERKNAEEDAFRLSKAIIQSPVSIVITDQNGRIEYVNPKFTEITGYTLKEVIGQNPRILKSGNQKKKFYKDLWTTILSGKNWKGEFLNKKKNGELFWENAIISPIMNDEGKITNFVAIKEDITEKRKMLEDLVVAKEKAEISEKIKTEFLAQMSHEIRSPLNVILNFVSLIKEEMGENIDEDIQFGFKSIDSASQRIIRTIDLILNMTDLQSGSYESVIREFDSAKTFDLLASEYKHFAATKNIKLSNNIKFKSFKLHSDEYAFTQVFGNLIDNAIKYTKEGSVEINAEKKKGKLIVSIKDTGIGMSKEFLPKLFSAFTQEEQGYSRSYDGNGLGMALVKRYCDLLKAEISVESEKGKGTTFTVIIPDLKEGNL